MSSPRPKVCLVATVAQHLRAFHLPWVMRLRSRGFEVHGVAADISSMYECVAAFDRVYDVPFSRNPLNVSASCRAASSMRRLVKYESYCLVHVHTPVAALVTRLALNAQRLRGDLKLVYTAHGFHFHGDGNSWVNRGYIALERLGGRATDALIVINREDYDAAIRVGLVEPSRLHLIPGVGIDLAKFGPGARVQGMRLREELGIPCNGKVIIMAAEFSGVKRHVDAIRALAKLSDPNVHLLLCGKGRLEQRMKELVHEIGLADRIHFLGFRRDMPALLAMADLGILVSSREGLPLSVMEAMASGLPMVGTNVRGIRDLLGRGVGVLVPPRDVVALSAALSGVLGDPKRRAAMTASGLHEIQAYALGRVLDAYESLYQRLLGKSE